MNYYLNRTLLCIVACVFILSNCKKKEEITEPTTLDIGVYHQGGIIAYILKQNDSGFKAGEVHGMIAASYDLDTTYEWGCYGDTLDGAKGIDIGSGYANTADIAKGCVTEGIAAKMCADLMAQGYDDWYLPGKMELNQLYLNRKKIRDFDETARYWSSSQVDPNGAWQQLFKDGTMAKFGKGYFCKVRPVRAF